MSEPAVEEIEQELRACDAQGRCPPGFTCILGVCRVAPVDLAESSPLE